MLINNKTTRFNRFRQTVHNIIQDQMAITLTTVEPRNDAQPVSRCFVRASIKTSIV